MSLDAKLEGIRAALAAPDENSKMGALEELVSLFDPNTVAQIRFIFLLSY